MFNLLYNVYWDQVQYKISHYKSTEFRNHRALLFKR